MIDGLKIIDDFLPDVASVRAHALASEFVDWKGYDGEVYKRVCLTDVPGLRERIEQAVGPVDMLGMGYRLNYDGELPNALIHSDLGWGTHALVLYLIDGPGGTAFWRHSVTGTDAVRAGDHDLLAKVQVDWDRPTAWEQRQVVSMKLGRAIVYESALYHSRYPFAAFGSTPEDGRLVAVAFFTPRGSA